jgi:hypothetical protein
LADDLSKGIAPETIAARAHAGLAAGFATIARAEAEANDCDTIALSGGCFQNKRLTERTIRRLREEARDEHRLLDATYGRKTRSVIIMDSNHIILSAIQAETISQRYAVLGESPE